MIRSEIGKDDMKVNFSKVVLL